MVEKQLSMLVQYIRSLPKIMNPPDREKVLLLIQTYTAKSSDIYILIYPIVRIHTMGCAHLSNQSNARFSQFLQNKLGQLIYAYVLIRKSPRKNLVQNSFSP